MNKRQSTALTAAERELAIVKSLDAVRQVALAMQTTDDLGPVVEATRDALSHLGIKPYRTTIALMDESKEDVVHWSSRSGKFYSRVSSRTALRKAGSRIFGARAGRKRWVLMKLNKRQLAAELRKYTSAEPGSTPQSTKTYVEGSIKTAPIPFYQHTFYFSGGFVGLGMDRELDKSEVTIARRATETFDVAYKRFVELDEKVQKNRELAVEAGLERVRAVALAMEGFDDLGGVARAITDEFEALAMEPSRVTINILEHEPRRVRNWTAASKRLVPKGSTVNYHEASGKPDPWMRKSQTYSAELAWKEHKASHHYFHATRKDRDGHREYARLLFPHLNEGAFLDEEHHYSLFFDLGYLRIVRGAEMSDADIEIGLRFAELFDFAYKRFLDLQEKERRARDAEIEAALERVRAEALAMGDPSDLGKVTDLFHDEIQSLGFDLFWLSLVAVDIDGIRMTWTAGGHFLRDWRVPDTRRPRTAFWKRVQEELQAARERGDEAHVIHAKGREVKTLVQTLLRAQGKTEKDIEKLLKTLPSTLVSHRVLHERGLVAFVREHPLDDEMAPIAKRFTDVFDFAFKRFLEMQAKEKRAREAEVEAAIERIRSQALAMESPDDLYAVAATLERETTSLYADAVGVGIALIGICDEEADQVTQWTVLAKAGAGRWKEDDYVVNDDAHVQIERFQLSALRKVDAHWRKAYRPSGGRSVFLGKQYTFEGALKFARRMTELGQWSREYGKETEIHLKNVLADVPSFEMGHVQFKHGYLWSLSEHARTATEISELERIGDVFAFAYDRFLGIQSKEQRAREAEVEAALERVRARALGMQESKEVLGVATVMRNEFVDLGYEIDRVNIRTDLDLKANTHLLWRAHPLTPRDRAFGEPITVSFERKNPQFKRWHGGEKSWSTQLPKSAAGQRRIRAHLTSEGYTKAQIDKRIAAMPDPYFINCVNFGLGVIATGAGYEFSDEDFEIAGRFADVFAIAYRRFKELEAKEAQNRELTIQNAIERVRSRAQGMQESRDICRMSPHIHYELAGVLGLPAEGVFVGALDRSAERVQAWIVSTAIPSSASMPEAIDEMPLGESGATTAWKVWREDELIGQYLDAWLSGQDSCRIQRPKMELFELAALIGSRLLHLGPKPSPDYWVKHMTDEPESVGFFSGDAMIHVNASRHLTDNEVAVVLRFAKVFEYSISRYLELKRLEAQNRELQVESALERVRAQAQGMQESNEVAGVVTMLSDEFVGLGHDLLNLAIVIHHEGQSEGWSIRESQAGADRFSRSPRRYNRPSRADRWDRGTHEARERGEPHYVFELKRKAEREAFFRKVGRMQDLTGKELDAYVKTGLSVLNREQSACHRVFSTHGWIAFWTENRLSDEDLEVARRFTDVFDYTYGRFRELEEKEDQNRELTIQNALERVRAQAQGMQVSDEIAGVAKAIYEEFQGLGYGLERANIIMDDGREEEGAHWWMFDPNLADDLGLSQEELRSRKPTMSPKEEREASGDAFRRFREARARGDWYVAWDVEGDALKANRRIHGRNHGLKGAQLRSFINRKPLKERRHFIFHAHGAISFVRVEPMSETDLVVAKRFTDVFDYAYDRFQELKEKEDQNRELTIQNALERVRARALGMQESAEIGDVATVLFEELVNLGFEATRSTISINDVENRVQYGWMSRYPELELIEQGGPSSSIEIETQYLAFTIPDNPGPAFQMWREGKTTSHLIRRESSKMEEYEFRRNRIRNLGLTHAEIRRYLRLFEDGQWHYYFFFKQGCLSPVLMRELSEEDVHVGKRFAGAFAQAYDRFEELQQKEEQNRELTVQNAIERVRSRALGMQESAEIGDVCDATYKETQDLGLDLEWLTISVSDSSDRNWSWSSGEGHIFRQEGQIMRSRSKLWRRLNEESRAARIRGDASYAHELKNRREVHTFVRAIMTHWGKTKEEIETRLSVLPSSLVVHRVFHEQGMLIYVRPSRMDDDTLAVAMRFTDTFGFAYSRFLELEEKEQRAREAEVEASIERVRARALGMQESADIGEVAKTLFTELDQLAEGTVRFTISIREDIGNLPPGRARCNWTGERLPGDRGEIETNFYRIDPDARSLSPEEYRPVSEARIKGLPSGSLYRDPGSAKTRERTRLKRDAAGKWREATPAQKRAYVDQFKGGQWHYFFFFKHGWVSPVMMRELSEEDIKVGERFAQVFDMAYDRFLELEEKEKRAREAEVEASIERVRARALGMQESADLGDVAKVLFGEMVNLGFGPTRSAITTVLDPEKGTYTNWFGFDQLVLGDDAQIVMSGDIQGNTKTGQLPDADEVDEHATAGLGPWIEAWREGEATHFVVERTRQEVEDRESLWPTMARLGSKRKREAYLDLFEDGQYHYFFFYKQGWVSPVLTHELSEDDIQVGERFAQVFGLAYDRFAELQQKEAQNRELAVEAALERVRAAALAMETSGDIEEATGVMFQELQGLSLPFYRGGVGIAEEEDPQVVELWGQDSKGAVSRGMHFNLYEHPVMARIGEAWQRGEDVYVAEAEGDELEDWKRYVENLGYPLEWPEDLEVYRNHCAYFRYGILYAVAVERLDDDDLNVIRRFRDAFAFAYNRYLELAEKERQNRELAVEGALERVRGKALAMEGFDDLTGVSQTIFAELTDLGFNQKRSAINVERNMFLTSRGGEVIHGTGFDPNDPHAKEVQERMAERYERLGPDYIPEGVRMSEAREKGDEHCWWRIEGEELALRHEAIRLLYPESDPDLASKGDPGEVEVHYRLFIKDGQLAIITEEELSEEEVEVGLRFARLFEFAYDRYKELDAKQKANRELSVEAALERLRGQALAMDSEDDLDGVAYSLFEEFDNLGFGLYRATTIIADAETMKRRAWFALTGLVGGDLDGVETVYAGRGWLDMAAIAASNELEQIRNETWMAGTERYQRQHLETDRFRERAEGWLEEERPDLAAAIDWDRLPPSWHQVTLYHKNGWLTLVSKEELDEDSVAIGLRFADLFEFAYDRFLELDAKQKANRELSVEAALERARGRALAMESFDDLTGVSETIFSELEELDFDPIRTAIDVGRDQFIASDTRDGKVQHFLILEEDDPRREETARLRAERLGPGFPTERDRTGEARDRGDLYCHYKLEGEELAFRREMIERAQAERGIKVEWTLTWRSTTGF